MGSWFSNLHIRKNDMLTEASVIAYLRDRMTSQQYLLVPSEAEADGAFAIVSCEESQWYSVYSDLFSFDEPKFFANYAVPMSKELGTDVMGISCFDSDYLYLNLIDTAGEVDAWAGVGSAAGLGIKRRTNGSPWKKKVEDYPQFMESIKKKYVFAEEALWEISHCIRLPATYGMASYEDLNEPEIGQTATYLYFKLPETMKTQEPPCLVQRTRSLMPCFLGKPGLVEGTNMGGASKGLLVYFVGPYVEHDEITFSDVCFVKDKKNQIETVPIALKKVQLSDGQWAYYYHDSGFKIPPKVDDRLPASKRIRTERERSITVRFVPHGNPGKILDITVALVPDKNPEGQTVWNVWHEFGSKKAYIAHHNQVWSMYPNCEHLLLREEDYD